MLAPETTELKKVLKMKLNWCIAILLICFSVPVLAQDSRQEILLKSKREKKAHLTAYMTSRKEQRFLGLEKKRFYINTFRKGYRGIRPVIGGMPSGSGFAGGVGYVRSLDYELFELEANARYSTRGFSELDAKLEFPTTRMGDRVRAFVSAAHQDYPSLRFFGLGNDSSESNRTTFGQRNIIFGGGLIARLPRSIQLTGGVSRLGVETEPGDRKRSLETLFAPATVPGFGGSETDFNVYRAGAELRLRDREIPSAGLTFRVEGQRYDDRDFNRFDFTRLVGEVQAHLPLGYRNRMLAVRLRTSHSNADDDKRIPFYLMETLGGARTIRGYREYRFRDTRNVLLNVEYRWEVWTYMDFALFFDAGKVFSDFDDTDASGFHTGYGFGVRVHGPKGTIFRVDLARSVEGVRLHIGAGPSF